MQPTVERDRKRQTEEQDEEEDARHNELLSDKRQQPSYLRETAARRRAIEEENKRSDLEQVPVAQCLFRLLPTSRLSSLYYLCAFFSQIPLCPYNGLSLEDIAALYADKIIGGPILNARSTLVWLLRLWTQISDGLLEADLGPDPVDPHAAPVSAGVDEDDHDATLRAERKRRDSSHLATPSASSRLRASQDSRKRYSVHSSSDATLAQGSDHEGKHDFGYSDDDYVPSVPTIQPVPAHARRISLDTPSSRRTSFNSPLYTSLSTRVESLPPVVSVDIAGDGLLADIKAELEATRLERDQLRDERDHALAVVDDALAAIDASRQTETG